MLTAFIVYDGDKKCLYELVFGTYGGYIDLPKFTVGELVDITLFTYRASSILPAILVVNSLSRDDCIQQVIIQLDAASLLVDCSKVINNPKLLKLCKSLEEE